MTVLVTGATGLLGSHLVELLLERGESVRAFVRPDEPADELVCAGVDICRGDLRDPASLEAAVRGVDRVLHCAARTGVWGPRSEYEIVNVRGLQILLDLAMAAGVRRFVHVSSHVVLGSDVRGVADETAPLRVEPNPYSWSKVTGERLLAEAIEERHAPVVIVRPGLIYGPRDAGLARFAAMIQRGRMILIGGGKNHMPLIYVRDVAEGILLASEAAEAIGRVYLLVNDEPVTQLDYLNAVASELGVRPPRLRIPYHVGILLGRVTEALGHLAHLRQPPPLTRFGVHLFGGENRFVINRARQEIGFSPKVNLAEGVRQSVAWYRKYHAGSAVEER